jgi:hypothetical protein
MGRVAGLWAPMVLFRFTASGQRDFTGGQDGQKTYFSTDGSNVYTGLQYHNPVNASGQSDGFDWADWDPVGDDANAHDPFGPGGPGAGDPGTLSATDIRIMDVLGWGTTPETPDTTPPSLVHEGSVSVTVGGTVFIPESQLQFDDNVSTHAQETYTVITAPADGTLLKNGVATSSFTQADIDNNLISYHETVSNVTSDSFIFKVTDAAGNQSTAQQFQFRISPAQPPPSPFGDFSSRPGEWDMLMRNSTTGAFEVYDIANNSLISAASMGQVGLEWAIAGFGDFSGGANETDMLMRNTSTGAFELYDISNNQITSAASMGQVGLEWHV